MKKFNNYLIDDFLIEKYINQWIWERTLEEYYQSFKLLYSLDNKYVLPSDLTTYTTNNFKRLLADNLVLKKWSSSTYNHYRKTYKSFCNFLVNESYILENPFDKIQKRKEAKLLPKTLTTDQIKELISYISSIPYDTYVNVRNKTIVYTYLFTWLRLSELINLTFDYIDLYEWFIRVKKWKWEKERIVPITKDLIKILLKYQTYIKNDNIDRKYFFTTISWKTLKSQDLKRIIEKIRTWITFHFTWHQLRHTYATELVRNNFDIFNISRILWHSRIDTTKIYLSSDTSKLKKQLDNINLFS